MSGPVESEGVPHVFLFLLQLRDLLVHHRLHLFLVYMAMIWIVWAWKAGLSRRYRPFTGDSDATTAVIIPVVDEPEDLFRDVLNRITRQEPDEIQVVINGPRNATLERICAEFRGVRWTWTDVPGKRNALRIGVEETTAEICVLVDSDTIWTDDTLPELTRPFADPAVGGATTKQRILEPARHVLTRWADWMESLRNEYAMPAMSVLGTVGCLPGRTIAFRRRVLVDAMDNFMHARFLGIFLEVSDDRTLTNECLKQGYKTVYQSSSVVYTDAPTNWKTMSKQQLRWARGSQYNTARMLPWMLRHARSLACFYLADIILPFLLLGAYVGWIVRQFVITDVDLFSPFVASYGRFGGALMVAVLAIIASLASSAVRQARHLRQTPSDLWRIPVFLVISTFLLMPIRLLGFTRMAQNSGWGTRSGGFAGETNRNALSLIPYSIATFLIVTMSLYQP
jgi:hyaluronan synthase